MVRIARNLFLIGVLAVPLVAHEIPNDVTVQAFVRPAGQRLQLLVRVPLAAMRDVDFPTAGPGYLDLDRVGALLPDAATLWISGLTDIYEDDAPLTHPRVVQTV